MPASPCYTLYRSVVIAGALWVASVGLMIAATVYAALHWHLGAALLGWAIIVAAAAAVVSVKYLIDKAVATALDEGALLLDAKNATPPGGEPRNGRQRVEAVR